MNILNLPLSKITSGMVIAKDVFSKTSGDRIIQRNTIINPKILIKLKMNQIQQLYVMVPDSLSGHIADEVAENTNKMKDTEEFKTFRDNYLKTTSALKDSFAKLIDNKNTRFDPDELLSTIEILSDETSNSMRTFELLQCMREYDDLTYVHSLNVALIAKAFGGWLNLADEEIRALTIAGLLHDIGKTVIPDTIIKKPGPLTEEEYNIVKKHPVVGYKLIADAPIDERIKQVVLLHHERSNGLGYPTGLKNDDIPAFAKVIAIADVYDAMTSNRVYRDGICPFDVVEKFEKDSFHEFDITYLLRFLDHIANAYIHASVLLSNMQIGEVVMINKQQLSAPIVNVNGAFYDLSKDKTLKITKVL